MILFPCDEGTENSGCSRNSGFWLGSVVSLRKPCTNCSLVVVINTLMHQHDLWKLFDPHDGGFRFVLPYFLTTCLRNLILCLVLTTRTGQLVFFPTSLMVAFVRFLVFVVFHRSDVLRVGRVLLFFMYAVICRAGRPRGKVL